MANDRLLRISEPALLPPSLAQITLQRSQWPGQSLAESTAWYDHPSLSAHCLTPVVLKLALKGSHLCFEEQ